MMVLYKYVTDNLEVEINFSVKMRNDELYEKLRLKYKFVLV